MKIDKALKPLFKSIKFDRGLARRIYRYQLNFLVGDKDRANFFGGGLIGVNNVYFTTAIVNKFYNQVVMIDLKDLKEAIDKAPNIIQDRLITGDPFNILIWYMVHLALIDKKLPKKVSERMAYDLVLIANYRSIAALHSKGFKWLGSEKLSVASYEALSNKFILKRVGSWKAFMEYRTAAILNKKLKNRDRLIKMSSDDDFLYVIADAHGAIKSTFKIMYSHREDWRIKKASIGLSSLVSTTGEGEEEVGEQSNTLSGIIESTTQKMLVKHSLIDRRIVTVIPSLVTSMSESNILDILESISKEINGPKQKMVLDYTILALGYMYELIRTSDEYDLKTDIGTLLVFLRGVLNSSRSTSPTLLRIRKEGKAIIKSSLKTRSSQLISRYVLAFTLYLFILSRRR